MQMGIDASAVPCRRFWSLAYSMMLDDLLTFGKSRYETRKDLDKALSNSSTFDPLFQVVGSSGAPSRARATVPDRATWGLLPEHQAGLRRAISALEASS